MSFEEWSNNKKKKKPSSFEEWSNASRGISKKQEEEDEKKRKAYLASRNNDDDIAPVRDTTETKGGNKDSWFKSGGFSDGVDGVGDFFGDLGQTIGGTFADLSTGVFKGAGRTVEGLADLGIYGAAKVGEWLGEDEFARKAKRVAEYDAIGEFTKAPQEFADQYSILGNKADMISEGLGQVGAIILTGGVGAAAGLGATGVTALTTATTGLSTMGTNIGEAYKGDATDEEAFRYGLSTGVIEAGTEFFFGGLGKTVKALGLSRGIGGLDDIFAKKLSGVITKSIGNKNVQKVLGNTLEYVVKSGGEGVEEVLSGLGSAVMKKLTYEDDETLGKLIEDENLLEQFVVGAITSSIAQGADYVKANKSGRDFVTGYTNNEQAVIDKEVERRVAEQEKGGKKLTKKEIGTIEEQVQNDMEHGQLDIEMIDEVLGGESYKSYKDTVKSEDDLKAEYDQLANIKKSDLTTAQEKRLAELEAMNLGDTTKRDELRKKLNDTVFPQLKDSKLAESYNQVAKKGEAFKADLSRYKGKQREAVERAVKSGVLNDTYRSHVLVDTLSRIEADKGITFDYTNNQKIIESGFAVKGKTVNGYADKNTGSVTLNVQSSQAWQSVVGHEITHVLEGTEAYGALRNALYAYAESKGELESRRTSLTELYRDMGADVESELTADLVGDYLFTDKAFVDHLTGNRNLFQKVYDEIKYLCKVATGKELTEIEKVKREFDRAWKEMSVNKPGKTSEVKTVRDAGEELNVEDYVTLTGAETIITAAASRNGISLDAYHQAIEGIDTINPTRADAKKMADALAPVVAELDGGENSEYSAELAKIRSLAADVVDDGAVADDSGESDVDYSVSVSDKATLDSLNEQVARGEYDAETNPDGGYYVTYKSMSFWGYDEDGNAILRSPMAEYVDGKLSGAYLIPKDKSKLNWYQATETIDEATGLPSGLLVKTRLPGRKSDSYVPASENQDLIAEDWSNLYFNLRKKVQKNGKWVNSDVPARYNPYEHSSNSMLNDQFTAAYQRDNLVTVKMYVPISEDNGAYRAKWSKDPTGWSDWKSGIVAGKIAKQKDLQRRVYLSRYAAPVEIVPDSEVAQAYKSYLEGTDVAIPDNVVSPSLLKELRNAGVPIEESGKVQYSISPETEGKTLYTGSPNTNIQQFKVGGVEGSRQSGDRYGRGVYLTTNQNTAKGYAGDSGKVYEINADRLNIFNLNDAITDEMKTTLQRELNGKDKQFRNSVLRNFRSEKAFTDFETAERFFDEQRKLWKEEDGYYAANKPDIKSANDKTGEAVIEYTDFANIENAIGNLTGNELYDALKSISTDDFASFITGHGFDGISFDEDADNQQYVIYRNEDRLNILNNGTAKSSDPDIRFSLSKSVEETKDLMALHNLQSSELAKTLELGGLPMPSIAVIKDTMSHEEYGDVSLILPKEAIDPAANKDNKVYGGDAWTPTYPKIEYKPNEKVAKKISNKYYELANVIGYDEVRPLYNYVNDLENTLNRTGGEASMLEKLYEDTGMMNVYLQDSGKGKVEPVVKETVTKISDAEAEMNEFIVNALGEDFVASFKAPDGANPMKHRAAFIEQHEEKIREAYKRCFTELYSFTAEEVENVFENIGRRDLMKVMRDAFMYTKNNGVTVKSETDYEATANAIRTAASDGYKEWVDGLFKGIEGKSGIRNNQDYYTRSGNPRSWDALHWENTLENVIKVMKGQAATGVDSFSPFNSLFGLSHKRYGSIREIKADSDRLGMINQDEYDAMKDSFSERFAALASSIKDPDERNPFIATDTAAEQIIEAVRSKKTKTGILNHLRVLNSRANMQTVEEVLSLVSDIANMPTGYFEAKPQRAVSLEEVGVFVIPNNADVKLKQELLNRGYSIAEYDPNVEGDRQRVVNQFEEYKFSLSNVGEEYAPVGNYSTPFRELALEEDVAPVAESATVSEAPALENIPVLPDDEMEYGTHEAITPEEEEVSPSDVIDKSAFFSDKASALYEEVRNMRKGKRVSRELGYLLDHLDLSEENKSESYDRLRTALTNIKNRPDQVVNERSEIESIAREMISDAYDETVYGTDEYVAKKIKAVQENIARNEANRKEAFDAYEQRISRLQAELDSRIAPTNLGAVRTELANLESQRRESLASFGTKIAQKQAELESKKNKDTKVANNIRMQIERLTKLRDSVDADYAERIHRLENGGSNPTRLENDLKMQIERLKRLRDTTDAQYAKSISDLEARAKKMQDPKYSRAMHKRAKMEADAKWAEDLLGDTSTWVDKKIGLQYATNTERRNLRDIVRDASGKRDIARADAIDDALGGQYNREQYAKNRELAQVRGKYAELKITKAEDVYIQMLGEFRHNPDTTLTEEAVREYYEKYKSKIDTAKVDRVIELARQDYDNFFERLNAELRAQGMREIPYRKGYFPHFTEPKQNFVQRLLNWKTQDNEIPTSIAGLTETFKPVRTWQAFDKTRHSDETDYSFKKGFDSYSDGALDWIYHMDTLQKRRAVENHIRFTHSDEGIQKRINAVYADEGIDATEAQAQIESILAEAKNPLNNFVQDFTTHTNILAGKKNSLDRTVEQWTNRHIYSVMSNVQNRLSANYVAGNVRSALMNTIAIPQSWAQVSPVRSLQATKDAIANAFRDDGMVEKSTFLTNRLREADKLYKGVWDKIIDKAGLMFDITDNFSAQVIWRSKYNQNIARGMSEDAAIRNADQFAENVMAGRSKGNEPTLFNAKNPFVKAFTTFQLEVNNQYQYLFKDVPNDLKAETNHWKFNLAKGYATAFIGAYIYNNLLERMTGSEGAFDPIGIIEELLRDLGLFDEDEEKEPKEAFENLKDNVLEQMPFVGGYLGGGRLPISTALPIKEFVTGKDQYGNDKSRLETLAEAAPYTLAPFGYGQFKKTVQGLGMFSDEHPVSGSYTDKGSLRFPVEDTPLNRAQAAVFGQYASENAREYFDKGYAPLDEKQIQEYIDVDMPIGDYREYREGLKGLKKTEEKFDYISGLDLPIDKKNILANNAVDRKEPVDLTNYDDFSGLEEFDFATKNPDKYAFAKSVGGYSAYKTYTDDLNDIRADKDASGKTINGSRKEKVLQYINNLDADYYTKIILYKSEYPSDDTYNSELVNYITNQADLTYEERVAVLTKLGFRVGADGQVYAE